MLSDMYPDWVSQNVHPFSHIDTFKPKDFLQKTKNQLKKKNKVKILQKWVLQNILRCGFKEFTEHLNYKTS